MPYSIRTICHLLILLLIGLGCKSNSSSDSTNADSTAVTQTTTASAVSAPPDSLCFRQVFNRDTTSLKLVLTGDRASGQIDVNPYEKDQARGPFSGTRTGNTITADWQRSGEGVTETHVLTMTLSGDSIAWGDGERVQQQGKWVLKQPGGTYRYALAKTACR
ncbi:hypothetical protein [Spirosoma rhododendri]|uniref:Uncharacterized protein n=1 Tax=Spirosoma rhododendri TaxID=2728024 RepID=A0A7L5DVB0_9BACT|nr:hypothetical protein [Spirosoma rhododendri]QJD80538.1 hypothetical protein HH216_20540 [Spirosoma rhododendri]